MTTASGAMEANATAGPSASGPSTQLSQDVHERAVQIQRLTEHLLVQVGQSLHARSRLHSTLQSARAKVAAVQTRQVQSSTANAHASNADIDSKGPLTSDEEMVLQLYGSRSTSDYIPNLKGIQRASIQYNHAVHQLSQIIIDAKERLAAELPRAQEREEQELKAAKEAAEAAAAAAAAEERARQESLRKQQQEEAESRSKQEAEEAARAENEKSAAKGDTIDLSGGNDSDDDDEKPLAGTSLVKQSNDQVPSKPLTADIDLTADSPPAASTAPETSTSAAATSSAIATNTLATDPAALLASLTGIPAASATQAKTQDGSSSNNALPTGFENFDFSSLGLGNFDPTKNADLSGHSGGQDALGGAGGTDFGSLYGASGNDGNLDFGTLDFNMDQLNDLDMSFLNTQDYNNDGSNVS